MKRAYPDWLRAGASKGGKTSKRKLTKREARRIASAGWEGAVGEARRAKLRAKTHNAKLMDAEPVIGASARNEATPKPHEKTQDE